MNKIKDQAVIELRKIIGDQQKIYAEATRKILNSNDKISKQINDINSLKVRFNKPFIATLKDYLYIICLFGLKQSAKELKMKNPKKLSIDLRSWINATSQTVTAKYLTETNQSVTLPVIDNIGRNLSTNELVYRVNLLFDDIKLKKSDKIISGLEGKALLRGRHLAVNIYNNDIKLEAEGFSAALIDTLHKEKVVAAQWSAILDTHVCELCGSLDGRIIDIDSPDFAFYSPGDMHLSCRCLWIYIRSTERPENRQITWSKPPDILLKKYGSNQLSSVNIDSSINNIVPTEQSISFDEAEDYIDNIMKDRNISFDTEDVKEKLIEAARNPRFKKYLESSLGNIGSWGRIKTSSTATGEYNEIFRSIGLRYTATNKTVYHELAHGLQSNEWSRKLYTYKKKVNKVVLDKSLLKTYKSAIGRYAEELKLKNLTESANTVLQYGMLTGNGNRPSKKQSVKFMGVLRRTGAGRSVVSKYSLVNADEYVAEGVGFFIDNPSALKIKDPGLYAYIEKLFGG